MKDRLKTLVVDSNGTGWRRVLVDTVLRGFLGITTDACNLPDFVHRVPLAHRLLRQWYATLSYVIDWREALCAASELDADVWNMSNLMEYGPRREAIVRYPLLVVLHSAAGDNMSFLLRIAHWFQRRRGKLVVFIGNEYDLMAEKIAFLRSTSADYVCSQLPIDAARWLYAECHPTQVLTAPHALNPKIYYPDSCIKRTWDLGFIGNIYPYYVGDTERTTLIHHIQRQGAELGLANQIRLNARVPRLEWARFLNCCKGIIGAEAGSYYLDRQGKIISQAKAFLEENPEAEFEEIFERFFRCPSVEHISGKCISSRHFEPVGTKTCQILLEGNYNGILQPYEHYIPVKKDLSNLDEVIRRFKDESYRTGMVERTFEFVMDQHTYRHRVQTLMQTIFEKKGTSDHLALKA